MEYAAIELSSDDSENSDDSQRSDDFYRNFPPVDIPSSLSSATSSKSLSQSQSVFHSRKRRSVGNADICKNTSKSGNKNQEKEKFNQEKLAKKRVQEINKIYKPGECMKYMKIEMHPKFLERWYAGDIPREVDISGAKILSTTGLFDSGLILWKRSVPPSLISNNGQVEMTSTQECCNRGLYVISAADAAEFVSEHKLAQHVNTLRDMAAVKLTLVIFGEQEYFKSSQKKSNGDKNIMTELELEMVITDLLVSTDCDTVLVNQANELALLIVQFTKAIAEMPYKKLKQACDEQADFYMRGDNKKCVVVDKNGNGLSSLWQQMIAVLPQSSLEISRALCTSYKTPSELYKALQLPEGEKRIADLGVTRSAVTGSKARRIGNKFAKKLHILFTAEDGNTLIE